MPGKAKIRFRALLFYQAVTNYRAESDLLLELIGIPNFFCCVDFCYYIHTVALPL